ncbi:ligase-associated DNA damage response endonuclease PdeM [Acidomonas methanolica]|uniref:ligase-associated DNA damage response endonuclease PdeM n=1 Tax=Acidomonas methanolica TaxID=437 RepID=UPI00211A5E63|nr:ligase-associated DNA damage response endonuclease PdeM [Acidomonas methanolica]
MNTAPLVLGGARLLLDPSGALFWPEESLLVVADLHLEKGTAFDRHGLILPPWDSVETLAALEDAIERHAPARLLALGDSFHDAGGWARLDRTLKARLLAIAAQVETVWLSGNHDPEPNPELPGHRAMIASAGPFVFRHEASVDRADEQIEISGHFHPKARMRLRGQLIARACFIADKRRVILPAFGAYTGGLDVSDPAIAGLFPRGATIFMRGRHNVYRFDRAAAA